MTKPISVSLRNNVFYVTVEVDKPVKEGMDILREAARKLALEVLRYERLNNYNCSNRDS